MHNTSPYSGLQHWDKDWKHQNNRRREAFDHESKSNSAMKKKALGLFLANWKRGGLIFGIQQQVKSRLKRVFR